MPKRAALKAYAGLLKQQKEAKDKRKAAQEDLDKKIDAKYPTLRRGRDQDAGGGRQVDGADLSRRAERVDRVSQTLSGRIRELAALRNAVAKALPSVRSSCYRDSTSGWGPHGTEAWLQEDRGGRHSRVPTGSAHKSWKGATIQDRWDVRKAAGATSVRERPEWALWTSDRNVTSSQILTAVWSAKAERSGQRCRVTNCSRNLIGNGSTSSRSTVASV